MLPITRRGGTRVGAGGLDDDRDPIDSELSSLLRRLSKIEAQVGSRRNNDSDRPKTGNRFLDLKDSILDELRNVQGLLTKSSDPGKSAREKIEADAKVKRCLRDLDRDWRELESVIQAEMRNETSEEVEVERQELLMGLRREIDHVLSTHRSTYSKGATHHSASFALDPTRDDLFASAHTAPGAAPNWSSSSAHEQEAISGEQQLRLDQIRERDRNFDNTIEEIGRGVDALEEIARTQHQEVKKQTVMLDDLQQRMDNVQDHLENVNAKMKTTLDKVGRSSDKLCVDIMCLILLIGMVIVMYKLFTS